MRLLPFALIMLLGLSPGCSRSQKSGKAISAQAIAKAMPEFTLIMPPGATNLYFEEIAQPPLTMVFLKLSVPRSSLTNFLTLSGLGGEFIPVPAGVMPAPAMPLPGGLGPRSALGWVSDAHHANEWELGRRNTPMRMSALQTSAKSSPAEQVVMEVEVDDSASPYAKVYLTYMRVPRLRR